MGKVLVIRGGAVGDFILTLPAIRLLKENLPLAEIEILGYEAITSLARASGYATRIRSIEYGKLAAFFAPGANLDEELVLYFRSFDVIVSYLYDPDGYFRGNLERIDVEMLIECSHKVRTPGPPAAEQLAQPLEQLALFLEPDKQFPVLEKADSEVLKAHTFLQGADPGTSWIAIHPGSGSLAKNWPVNCWKELILRIQPKFPSCAWVIITGEAEVERIGNLIPDLQSAGFPLRHADQLPLPRLGEILRLCNGFLGHDSGVSHLAAAVGTPGLLLFGPTDPAVWAPRNPAVEIVQPTGQSLTGLGIEAMEARVTAFLKQLKINSGS
ncbi:MAG: glycosyltransferase family 9 protein [Verrucomicrobiota bacterium]